MAERMTRSDPIRTTHLSDCAVHNEPAYLNGPCDCRAAMDTNSQKMTNRGG